MHTVSGADKRMETIHEKGGIGESIPARKCLMQRSTSGKLRMKGQIWRTGGKERVMTSLEPTFPMYNEVMLLSGKQHVYF